MRTCVLMGNAGSDYGYFQRSLKAGHFASAWQFARQLPSVSLADALSLTTLAATEDPDQFDRLSLRWLVRLTEERSMSLAKFAEAAAELQGVKLGLGSGERLRALLREAPLRGRI